MRALNQKLLRDLVRLKTQALAIALVVASAIALFVGTAMTSRALILSQRQYYDEHRFAHVWSRLARAPESVTKELAAIPGVTAVEGRVILQGIVDLPAVPEPVNGLFIGIPDRPGHGLNDIYVRRGRHVEPVRYEALVSEAFAERNGLSPGDRVRAIVAGHAVTLTVVGIALSPEFIMQIPPSGLVPDERRFGVFWLPRDQLDELVDMRGVVNDVALRLSEGTADAPVITAVDRMLDVYGGLGAYGRSSQPSHVMLEAHIRPVAALAVVVPSIFLIVAVFLVNVVLSRTVATERSQIGMLKAFGYSNARLAAHYVLLVSCIVAGGTVLGLPIGIWLGHLMSVWFGTFFRFPVLVIRLEPLIVAIGALVMWVAAAVGTLTTVWSVVTLPPMVAMSANAPVYRPTLLDRMSGLLAWCAPPVRMIVRSISRRPVRALVTAGGMSLAIAIVVFGGFTADSMARVLDVRFQRQAREDMTIVLTHARSLEERDSLEDLPGVRIAEPYRAVPARLRVAASMQDVTLVGLEPGGRLRRIIGLDYRSFAAPEEGVIVSRWLAQHADVHLGDRVALEIREGRRRIVAPRVVGLVDEALGTNIYVGLTGLGRLLNEPATFSAANVLLDPTRQRELFDLLKRAPAVLGVDFRTLSMANFRAMSDQSVSFIRQIEVIFAVIIAFGVVYNTARIALAERAYELATLRVLGFTRAEISGLLLGEVGLLAAPAIPIGCVVGYGLSVWLSSALSTKLFRFPVVVEPTTYAFAIGVFAVAAAVSALVVRRRLDHLDLIDVLKARE